MSDGEIPARTLVWTAGTAPNPLLKTLPLETDRRGAVVVESTMAANGTSRSLGGGRLRALKDAKTGNPCPPTAQFALREARVLARNIRAALQGRALSRFTSIRWERCAWSGITRLAPSSRFRSRRGKSVRFRGLLAWLLWRGIYLGKLPGLERKIRVLSDWVIELFFPRDIVQTIELK